MVSQAQTDLWQDYAEDCAGISRLKVVIHLNHNYGIPLQSDNQHLQS